MDIAGKRILVTGGTGLVGSHLVEELVSRHNTVVTTYLTEDPRSYFDQKQLGSKTIKAHADICDFDTLFHLVTDNKITHIFHLAAQPIVETAYANPRQTIATNVMGTTHILELARLLPDQIKGIVVASSDKAYGKLDKKHYLEHHALKGDHPYDASKSAGDLVAQAYFKTYHIPVIITRFGNIYGEGDLNLNRIIPGIIHALITDQVLDIRSDGTYVRDYLYVKDVVLGYIELMESVDRLAGEAFNFGSKDTLSVIALIKSIESALGKKLQYRILNTAKNEIPYQSLSDVKVRKAIGWKNQYTIRSVIKQVYEWYSTMEQTYELF